MLYIVSFILKSYCCFKCAYFKAGWRNLVNLHYQYYSLVEEEENGVSVKHFYKCPYFLRLAIIFTFIDICYLSFKGATSSTHPCSSFCNLNFIRLYKGSDEWKLLTILSLLQDYWILVAFSGIRLRLMHSLGGSLGDFHCMDIHGYGYFHFQHFCCASLGKYYL